MRLTLAVLLLALVGSFGPGAQTSDAKFQSAALQREMPYRVILPGGYPQPAKKYPVLYLLHGLDGHYTDWTGRTKLAAHVAGRDLIVVMPEGANSWYVNWHEGGNERWEDYLAGDLVAEIDARFATNPTRDARFIGGLSMGGYGAVRIGLKYPQRFAVAASLSGAFNITRLDTFGWTDGLRAEFARAFGPVGSERRASDDIFALAKRASPQGLPFFYIDCGTEDQFLAANRELAATLQERKIPYEYRETPGAHNWMYWNRQVVELLRSIPVR